MVKQLQLLKINDVLFIRLAGGIFVALGILFIFSGKLTTLTCNRVEPNKNKCQLVSSGLLGLLMPETKLIELKSAAIQDNPMDNDASRVILLTSRGKVPFTDSTGDNDAAATVSQINTFIQQAEKKSLFIQQDERGLYFPLGGFIITLGLFTLAFSRTSKVHF
jgi:hypothetical protein